MKKIRYARKLKHPKINAVLLTMDESCDYMAGDMLRRLDVTFGSYTNYRDKFFDEISPEALKELLEKPPVSNRPFEQMLHAGVLPTSFMLNFALRGEDVETAVKQAADATFSASFDRSNPIQMEREYSIYVLAGSRRGPISRYEFNNLPWRANGEVLMGDKEIDDSKQTAREAAAVFHMIKDAAKDRGVLIIANARYGSYFVVTPIARYLDKLGIPHVTERVSSLDFFNQQSKVDVGYLSYDTWNTIARKKPDVVVVDGTRWNMASDQLTRFPAAMRGYINAFRAFNVAAGFEATRGVDMKAAERLRHFNPMHAYAPEFWAPELTGKFFLDHSEYEPEDFPGATARLVLTSSTGYGGGMFDDPEDYTSGSAICLTPKGLNYMKISDSNEAFVAAAQAEIEKEVKRLLG